MQEQFVGVNRKTKFKKGDLVVCTDDRFSEESIPFFNDLPIKGEKYTVRDSFVRDEQQVVLLEEIQSDPVKMPFVLNEGVTFSFEPLFSAIRFELKEEYENLDLQDRCDSFDI